MNCITSPIRLVQPAKGWLAKKTVLELSAPTEEMAVICRSGSDSYRLAYAEDSIVPDTKSNPLVLESNELAFILTRDLSVGLQVPVSFGDGFPGNVELSLNLRILRPELSAQHPIFSRIQVPCVSDMMTFESQLIRVIRNIVSPVVQACFEKKSFLKLDWSAEELQAMLREHFRAISGVEHIGLREAVLLRVSSEEGEAFSLQRRECLRRLEEAESQEILDKRWREIEASKALAESETKALLELARVQREQRLELEKLVNQGHYEEAHRRMELGAVEQAEKKKHLILESQLSEQQKRVAHEQWMRSQQAESAAHLAQLEAKAELARLSVREKELEIEMKKQAAQESAARTEREAAEAQRLEAEKSTLADQLAACHDFLQKLTKDFEEALATGLREQLASKEVQVLWRSFQAMEKPWKPERLRIDRERLGNFEFVCSGASLQLLFETQRAGCLYVFALGPYVADGRIEYRWVRLFSNDGGNDLGYRFSRSRGNCMAAGEKLLLPVAADVGDPADTVWTLNTATGRELLYVVFTETPLSEAQVSAITQDPRPRFYTTRGFVSRAAQPEEDPATASWDAVTEDYRAAVVEKIKSVAGAEAFVSESVFYHVR